MKTKAERSAVVEQYSIDESVEPETRRRHRSPVKVQDDDYEDDQEDVLPEAQPSHSRNEVDMMVAKFRQSVLHVYGLDFLKTGHMDEIFNQFNHKFVEWINDSSANIIFSKDSDAKRALDALSFAKAGDEPWRRTPDILVSETMPPIFLQMRLACSTDVKRPKKAMPSIPVNTRSNAAGDRRRRGMQRKTGSEGAGLPQSGLSTKRPKLPLTEEEQERRTKRATRFGDWMDAVGTAVAASEGDAKAPAAVEGKPAAEAAEPAEPTEEETSKRKARSERFAESAK
mmetsp:Transcript_13106/g.35864  ORF Transcript_13106/g.35864 Transcript_13106/m.35864 type:complete len:284 (+) Transcript_13106:110-961(+)|eukprot:CAMPEP_0177164492 /NCGR_PEP_ID=MMETSP0367-20130122/6977_1 /TAXON_ID=447022 ORGANISM="Scrippsiella hangoei-like, Strain SHHI-4" /NCGR_SAMPLE_ID=MMETSP0367 /ASSEMBLY_ACC=CAM_ASM_000362 /LENGTH=283 /DNA_ID=CAMNT_0018610393 /DNA_START=110 /DNA_END=961 /DNA_ORIENTATION=-